MFLGGERAGRSWRGTAWKSRCPQAVIVPAGSIITLPVSKIPLIARKPGCFRHAGNLAARSAAGENGRRRRWRQKRWDRERSGSVTYRLHATLSFQPSVTGLPSSTDETMKLFCQQPPAVPSDYTLSFIFVPFLADFHPVAPLSALLAPIFFQDFSHRFLLSLVLIFCLDLLRDSTGGPLPSHPRSRQDEILRRTSTRYLSECVRQRSWEIANWIF